MFLYVIILFNNQYTAVTQSLAAPYYQKPPKTAKT